MVIIFIKKTNKESIFIKIIFVRCLLSLLSLFAQALNISGALQCITLSCFSLSIIVSLSLFLPKNLLLLKVLDLLDWSSFLCFLWLLFLVFLWHHYWPLLLSLFSLPYIWFLINSALFLFSPQLNKTIIFQFLSHVPLCKNFLSIWQSSVLNNHICFCLFVCFLL